MSAIFEKGRVRGRVGNLLLFVPRLAGFGAVGPVGQLGRVEGGALLAGGVGGVGGRVGGVGQAGPGLARVVVKLHQAEYQVRLHQLKRIRRIGYNVSGGRGERKQSTNQDEIFKDPGGHFVIFGDYSWEIKGDETHF